MLFEMDYSQRKNILLLLLLLFVCFCVGQDSFYFSRKPEDQDVVEGSETILYCDVSNKRMIEFSWVHNKKNIKNTSRRFQDGSNLRILRVTREEDEGPFHCVATNKSTNFALQSTDANLNIQWIEKTAQVELKKIKEGDITVGSELTLKCLSSGNPEPLYIWYHNNFRLISSRERKKVAGNKLRITGITVEDNGVYSCRAENVAGAVDSKDNFILNVPAPRAPHLNMTRFTKSVLVLKGEPAELQCPFEDANRVEWFNNYEKMSNDSKHTIFPNGTLYFPRVRQMEEGSYRCEGLSDNRDIPAQGFIVQLNIAYIEKFSMSSFEPRLIPNFPMVFPTQQRFVVKVFMPDANPPPRLRWFDRNDLEIQDAGQIHVEDNNLIFEDPQEVHSGNYTCEISNIADTRRQSVWIIVSVPPIIRRAPQSQDADEGSTITFSCQVSATKYPVTTIIWDKDGEFVPRGSNRHDINVQDGILTIQDVNIDDAGAYSCVANTTGQENLVYSDRAYLGVRKKLKFSPPPRDTPIELLDTDAMVNCRAEGDGHVEVKWFKEGSSTFPSHVNNIGGTLHFYSVQRSDAGSYTCRAFNAKQGTIHKTIFISVVERPKFKLQPTNTTVMEGQPAMLHCRASGEPQPVIIWDKDNLRSNIDPKRFTVYSNGTLFLSKVFMEDRGKYGCTANNTAGKVRKEVFLNVAGINDFKNAAGEKEEGFDMMKTIIIAVCSAGAYLALVIGLTAFCSYRLLMQRRNRKSIVKSENGDLNREQHELLMKDRDSETRTPFRSDSDNRSHISGLSSQPSHSSNSQHSQPLSLSHCPSLINRSRRGSFDRLQFPRQGLQTLGMLGKGIFGDVFLAKAHNIRDSESETLVIVKALLNKDENIYFEFRQEMEMFSKLDHPFVAKLLGVCREMEPHYMITEYCDWGDLKQYLLATRNDNGRRISRVPPLTPTQKLNMCHQVALAMEHIANNRLVHKDLATRNVLLTSNLSLKVSSLSMCKDAYASEYFVHNQTYVPLRWLSPEVVIDEEYSTKSDMWSFGVFVWEVFHVADLPYQDFSNEEVIKHLKVGDLHLHLSPELCPIEITNLIHRCMSESPRDRPQFSEMCLYIGDLLTGVQTQSTPSAS